MWLTIAAVLLECARVLAGPARPEGDLIATQCGRRCMGHLSLSLRSELMVDLGDKVDMIESMVNQID